ncbi:MAG: hypothetical protein Q9219_001379 [cf. Caloplaca sp. 3 TL-2023]
MDLAKPILQEGTTHRERDDVKGGWSCQVIQNDKQTELHVWLRQTRKSRFSEEEQNLLNTMIRKEIKSQGTPKSKAAISAIEREAKRFSLEQMMQTAASRIPAFLAPELASKGYIGQAYNGKAFEFKRKSPVCETVYPYPVPVAISLSITQLRDTVGEADLKLPENARECCAEAIPS